MGGTVIIGGDVSGTVVEDGVSTYTGDLDQTGSRNGTETWSITTSPDYGAVSINAAGFWTYTLDNTNAAVDSLDDGQIMEDTFTVTLNIGGVTNTQTVSINIEGNTDPCYVKGTKILTDRGWVRIEMLKKGALVATADGGFKPIQWIGDVKRKITEHNLPIVFPKNCFAHGCPSETLMVSPQHLILLENFGKKIPNAYREVFVPAHFLAEKELRHAFHNEKHPFKYKGKANLVHYFHILLDAHHVIHAQNVSSESLNLGPIALDAFLIDRSPKDILQIESLAHKQREISARPILKRDELKNLLIHLGEVTAN